MAPENPERFKIIDHTADLGIEVSGRTLNELFENAAYGMFSLITDISKIKSSKQTKIKLDSSDTESLLIIWLNELQYHYSVKKMLFNKFRVNIALPEGIYLESEVYGGNIKNHEILHDVKAATYHDLKITQTSNGYKTCIILDV